MIVLRSGGSSGCSGGRSGSCSGGSGCGGGGGCWCSSGGLHELHESQQELHLLLVDARPARGTSLEMQ